MIKRPFKYIVKHLSDRDLILQLAEESAELSAAAAKLVRVMNGTNPTPVSEKEAYARVMEEIVDTSICVALAEFKQLFDEDMDELIETKLKRWAERLHDALEGGEQKEENIHE